MVGVLMSVGVITVGIMSVGVMTVGVMSVGEITVGVMTVGVMTVGVMRRPQKMTLQNFLKKLKKSQENEKRVSSSILIKGFLYTCICLISQVIR
jgi:hypothetical protein